MMITRNDILEKQWPKMVQTITIESDDRQHEGMVTKVHHRRAFWHSHTQLLH